MMQTEKDCGKCSSGGVVGQMVGCDMCDIWFHAGCVGETEASLNPDRTWKCSHCAKEDAGERASRHTNKSARSSASSRARRELLLQQLEEQRALKLKQRAEEDEIRKKRAEEDEVFLQQKLNLILEDDNESRSSRLSSRASRKKVVDWLNNGQGGQPVATGSSHNGAIPQLPAAQQLASSSTSRAVGPAHPASEPAAGFPTSSSTPQSGPSTSAAAFYPQAINMHRQLTCRKIPPEWNHCNLVCIVLERRKWVRRSSLRPVAHS
nr:uncharacterized protein LOC115266788 [Aedes albopictus]